jgi:O-antigen ligase
MFSIAFGRDTPAMWIVMIMILYFFYNGIFEGGSIWFERSHFWLVLFVSAYIISTLVIVLLEPHGSWLGRTPVDRALTTLLRVIYVATFFIVCSSFFLGQPKGIFLQILKTQIAIGGLIALFGLIQYVAFVVFGYDGLSGIAPTNEAFAEKSSSLRLGMQRVYRATSIFNEPAWFGFYLAPLVAKTAVARLSKQRIFNDALDWALLVVFSLAVMVNFSLTGLVSLTVVSILYLIEAMWKKRGIRFLKQTAIMLLAIVVVMIVIGDIVLFRLGLVFQFQDPSTLDRLFRLFTGATVFWENFWLGIGPGGYAFLYPKLGGVDRTIMATPLNIWFTFLTDVGLLGTIPFLFFLFSVLRRMNRYRRENSLMEVFWWGTIAYLVVLTTTDYWFGELLWMELAVSLSLVAAIRSADNHASYFGQSMAELL